MGFCGFEVGLDKPLFSIAEPCVIAPESLTLEPLRPLLDTLKLLSIKASKAEGCVSNQPPKTTLRAATLFVFAADSIEFTY